ncbi:uncharacterized protein PFL1_04710 [Pseudozyma flocculosa PF-1]|uniref:Cyanovirin-N domain-containing protein n=2 Tax=Pseudozyma flocculosa TaxID=84751 RepID=A0A5C3F5A9_9BASI|nr:uncharacterized protein PFL1_04710 [Pseudozyma flocculosa PF-1]EPQ27572.1 hypothetical protein PFL1_04710 [Pseudozyma flocculosa PF-1]SPO39300.1 uncharacterized protein PSFLO_04780 [Pseudozyma flocculosa]
MKITSLLLSLLIAPLAANAARQAKPKASYFDPPGNLRLLGYFEIEGICICRLVQDPQLNGSRYLTCNTYLEYPNKWNIYDGSKSLFSGGVEPKRDVLCLNDGSFALEAACQAWSTPGKHAMPSYTVHFDNEQGYHHLGLFTL